MRDRRAARRLRRQKRRIARLEAKLGRIVDRAIPELESQVMRLKRENAQYISTIKIRELEIEKHVEVIERDRARVLAETAGLMAERAQFESGNR